MMGDTKQHAACCCTALGVNVANFMLSSFYNCNVANMFERAGVRSCVGTFSSSIHVLSMAQSAKYTLHLLLASVQLYFAQLSTCTVSAIPRQGGCMLPSTSGIMMIHLLVSAAPGCAGQRSQDQAPSLWSQNLEPINCGEQQAGDTRLCTPAVLAGWCGWTCTT